MRFSGRVGCVKLKLWIGYRTEPQLFRVLSFSDLNMTSIKNPNVLLRQSTISTVCGLERRNIQFLGVLDLFSEPKMS